MALDDHPNFKYPNSPSFAPKLYGIVLIIAMIVVTGLWLVTRFTTADMARDMQTWQEKLNLIAESRTAEIDGWVNTHFKSLRALAGNPSLQLYLSELQADSDAKKTSSSQPAQKSYLRNLILFTAEQTGFVTGGNQPINANLPNTNKSGLAVVDNAGNIVVSTNISPAMAETLRSKLQQFPKGEESLINIEKDSEGSPYMGFVVPIFAIQAEHKAEAEIGKIVGIKMLDEEFFNLLKHPGTTEKSLETILFRVNDGIKIQYLSPLQDGTPPLTKQSNIEADKYAESDAVRSTGSFSSDKKDYRNQNVLATSRAINGTPWLLMVKIDSQEGLAESNERRAGMVVLFFMLILVITLTIATVWWQAHSRRAMMMSHYFRRLAAQTHAQEQLLRLVTDHQPEPIYIVDTNHIYRFVNHQACKEVDMTGDFMLGKTLRDVRGLSRANYIQEQCSLALKENHILYDLSRMPGEHREKVIRYAFIPLESIPISTLPEPTPGVLIVEQDISDIVHEREKRLQAQSQLIQTLVKLVDKRDPFSANHSCLVSQLAQKIAANIELSPSLVETTRVAGSLMNIGKIVIPAELLTKSGSLTAAEKKTVQEATLIIADLLKDIDFDGPVAETLRQWQEKWDGTGPLGLHGEGILISARIIAVVNAFIGMVSPRAWRTAIPIESAAKFLMEQCDTHFDRRVVAAVVDYMENHHGRAWLEDMIKNQRCGA